MEIWKRKFFFILGLLLPLVINSIYARVENVLPFSGTSISSDTLVCNTYEGDLRISYTNQGDSSEYTFHFFLADTNNVILQINDSAYFSNVLEGCYLIYALENKIGESIQGNIIGNLISDINSVCFSLSSAYPITICAKPNAIKTVSGIVFNDTNEDGFSNDGSSNLNGITVQFYEDNNQNGFIDTNDSLLGTSISDVSGQYSYTIDEATIGRLVTHVLITSDTSTIPSNRYYTTDNLETAIFSIIDGIDENNNFGISQQIDLENEVWLDINGNGIQEPIEVNISNLDICIENLSPILIDGIVISPGGYLDTVTTDTNGIFIFKDLPDCNWQLIAHYDATRYVPTYDADGGILNITDFTLSNGAVTSANNPWCIKDDCLTDLDFGFRLAGELNLSGNVCIDDGSKDGNCNSGGEAQLSTIILTLFDERGDKLGGVRTNQDGTYVFPNLLEDTYIVDFDKKQISFEEYFFTTRLGDTPASKVVDSKYFIDQKVSVKEDVFGVDFAFYPHLSPIARTDTYILCPGLDYENSVSSNDTPVSNLYTYSLIDNTQLGDITLDANGIFSYTSFSYECTTDQFTYQLCDLLSGDCDTAVVNLVLEDNTKPTLLNIPADITINCDEQLPEPGLVSSFDNCPNLSININELSTQGEDGCSQYDYQLTRIWTATDFCGNAQVGEQVIKINDNEPPNIFRIYTLPNGKKLIAGTTKLLSERWKTIPFPLDFDTPPLLFNQVTSNNESSPIIVQTRRVSTSQFEIRLKEEEANDDSHLYEEVSWIAIEQGAQQDKVSLIANSLYLGEEPEILNFSVDFSSTPVLFTNLQTTNEKDPVTLSYENLTKTSCTIKLIEEASKDTELTHLKEKIAYLGIGNIGNITNNKGDIIGEIDTISIKKGWNTINLNNSYYNPIVIVSSANNLTQIPYTHRVNNVTQTSFEVEIQAWEYLGLVPDITKNISYIVLEGSIPLYTTDFCQAGTDNLVIGKDFIAVDNCDNNVEISYTEESKFNGIEQIFDRIWKSRDECGNEISYTQRINCEGVAVKLQAFLQGALIGSDELGLMRDDLRRKKLIPIIEPYSTLPTFQHMGSAGGEVLKEGLLNITGPNAIVDWLFLELRSGEDINKVIATSVGLLQRDGDIMAPTGDSLIVFRNVDYGEYYLAIRHRNHIGLSTKEAYSFNLNAIPEIDFRNVFTAINGKTPSIKIDGRSAQWSGDLNGDGKIIYQGPQNDAFEMFLEVILDDKNSHYLTNFISSGYTTRDFNMDGRIIYQGPNNDRASLLIHTILAHPQNETFLANFIISVTGNVIGNKTNGN